MPHHTKRVFWMLVLLIIGFFISFQDVNAQDEPAAANYDSPNGETTCSITSDKVAEITDTPAEVNEAEACRSQETPTAISLNQISAGGSIDPIQIILVASSIMATILIVMSGSQEQEDS